MNRNYLIEGISIFIIIITIFLIGCIESTENTSSGDSSKIELVNYTVYTYEYIHPYPNKIADGFNSDLENVGGYIVEGTIKNIADETVDAKVIANFYDNNGTLLHSTFDWVNNIDKSDKKEFQIWYRKNEHYFEKIDNVKIELKVI